MWVYEIIVFLFDTRVHQIIVGYLKINKKLESHKKKILIVVVL